MHAATDHLPANVLQVDFFRAAMLRAARAGERLPPELVASVVGAPTPRGDIYSGDIYPGALVMIRSRGVHGRVMECHRGPSGAIAFAIVSVDGRRVAATVTNLEPIPPASQATAWPEFSSRATWLLPSGIVGRDFNDVLMDEADDLPDPFFTGPGAGGGPAGGDAA